MQSTLPTPPKQLFLKQKPPNGYRIFVLGESSTAGFPYGNNASFPNVLGRSLSDAFPDRRIEVISVAMAAINSYALLDLVDELLKQSPDALLIYTGHNEYYGALGVGSVLSFGNSRWLIRTYLRLQSIKVFLLMRDLVGWLKTQVNNVLHKGSELDPSATLMEGIVAEQTILYGSPLYEAGKRQFEENMDAILRKAVENGVPVVLSELVSNVRDQEPLISVEDKDGHSAMSLYSLARRLEANGEFEKARQHYIRAKDLDALRFRAPEDFNVILRELAKKYSLTLVPAESYFDKESPNGITGSTLMLEHLHPNTDGYFLLAKAFYETMQAKRMISDAWPPSCIDLERKQGITELDSVYGALVIRRLKDGWPFKSQSVPNRFLRDFRPTNHIEEIAFRAVQGGDYSLESAHMELGRYYEKQGDFDKAFAEYNALVTSIPSEIEFYQKAATVLLKQKSYENASQMLRTSLKYKESDFANKWIGQIALMKNDYKEAISFLQKGDPGDAQVVFNLSRAFYSDNQWDKGEEYYLRLRDLAPRSQYVAHLTAFRASLQAQRTTVRPHQ
jgi:tetratricopeptide (TPR) repeat protein